MTTIYLTMSLTDSLSLSLSLSCVSITTGTVYIICMHAICLLSIVYYTALQIPGVGPETGGVVDFARFPRVLDAIRLLEAAAGSSSSSDDGSHGSHGSGAAAAWTDEDRSGMRSWCKRLLTWCE